MPIVEAHGSASGRNISAKAVEQAMAQAAQQCAAEGVADPAEIKRRMLEARERVKRGR